ncbi:hypothetical protein LUZ60_004560 [Juncus effusus]|nr:hypothetical protein LUZ60_004560 [Juncus effusus]
MASHHLLLSLLLSLIPFIVLATIDPVHLHFYLHKTVSGSDPTAVDVAKGPTPVPGSVFNFGDIVVLDVPLTQDPSPNSTLIGRAQGFYVVMKSITVEWTLNIVFTTAEYNGSTLAILGRDEVALPVREMSVVGGSGAFRMASGYVFIKTYSVNFTTGDAELEVDAFVYSVKK